MLSPQIKRWVDTNKKIGRHRSNQIAAYSTLETSFVPSGRSGFKVGNQRLSPSLKRWMGEPKPAFRPKPSVKDTFGSQPQIAFRTKQPPRITALRRSPWSEKMPPSLHQWAVDKGIIKTQANVQDPRKVRSQVSAIERKREVFEALNRGEWCWARDLEHFPPRLRAWLKDCRVRLLRDWGGGRISGTPVNGYVTEDGLVFYVAEDGSTFYVQES